MSDSFASCPFCGSHLKSYEANACNGMVQHYHPHHKSCPLSNYRLSKRRVVAWNTRTPGPALAAKDATIAELADDRCELLMAIENAARMAEQGILSADGGQCAGEIRALVPARFRAALETKP